MATNSSSKKLDLLSKSFSSIPIGRNNAISPNKSIKSQFQSYVDSINSQGDVVIPTKDGKYFRPNPLDEEDDVLFHEYIASEYEKASDIITRCLAMQKAYNYITLQITNNWKELSQDA